MHIGILFHHMSRILPLLQSLIVLEYFERTKYSKTIRDCNKGSIRDMSSQFYTHCCQVSSKYLATCIVRVRLALKVVKVMLHQNT